MDTSKHNQNFSFEKLMAEQQERLKELACINKTTQILNEGKSISETLQKITRILPDAWQYPLFTKARIQFDNKIFKSSDFVEGQWKQAKKFKTIDNNTGTVEVFYTKQFPEAYEGPFLKEESDLIENLANLIKGYINSEKAKQMMVKKPLLQRKPEEKPSLSTVINQRLLQRFLNKNNINRDIFHDLMPFKVKEILLIANLYDAFSIEEEGRFSEHILGEYHQLNLSSLPRITGVSSYEEAEEQLQKKHYDLIIIMMGVDKKTPITTSSKLKINYPYIPIYLLVNNNADIQSVQGQILEKASIDRIFVWNGDSNIFFAMVKHLEDKVNLENDAHIGMVRIILLVEDSAKYYSRYLPMLYTAVLEQTKRIIEDVSSDDLYKVLRMRARPKIILASSYDDAIEIFDLYKEFFLCLITDMKFIKNGKLNDNAGVDLVNYVRESKKDMPIIIQSSDSENVQKAYDLQVSFINKNSQSLLQDIKSFIRHHLGFGNFVYRDKDGKELAIARNLKEFIKHLQTIDEQSIYYHAKHNHFSTWLMARGEILLAKQLQPIRPEDFENINKLRVFLIDQIDSHRKDRSKGKIVNFDESELKSESSIVSFSSGNLGGKGRGLTFANSLIYNLDFSDILPDINIKTPKTCIIGTDEFDFFLERNHLIEKIYKEQDFANIKELFIKANLSFGLVRKLRKFLKLYKKPLAIRSSGLFEDSLMQPFAGIFETYLIPNNHQDLEIRLNQLMSAIKLVFASVYSKTARGYINAINYRIEEEKMAVIIQEVVGNSFGNYFYPHISGVAQSYNYYPYAHMKPEEGFAVAALGLGCYVVEGEKAFRFSPKFPDLQINSPKDQFKNSQVYFYAVDLSKKNINLLKGENAALAKLDIDDADMHGSLKHCASVYNLDNDTISAGLSAYGPRIVNFANVLKHNYIPLAKTIQVMLDMVKNALGTPVEIEFGVDLNKDSNGKASFYLLQIKPLIGNAEDYSIDMEDVDKDKLLLYTEKAMGNGSISNLQDVIYVKNETFDNTLTEQMAQEIDELNTKMCEENTKYVLIGPGRWGSRDKFIGIPVVWPQISNAKIIVETSLQDFPLDGSSGSHFFHNVTSMNVGYFTVQQELKSHFIRWEMLENAMQIQETKFFRHVRFNKPLSVKMDGKKRISIILID